jgi:hypothetical protein
MKPEKISSLLSSSEVLKSNFWIRTEIFENSEDINGQAIGFYSYATELITKGVRKRRPFDGKDSGNYSSKCTCRKCLEFSLRF